MIVNLLTVNELLYIYCEHKDEMRQSASALYSEVLTNRDLGIALFIKCLVKGSLENEGLSFFVHLFVL